MGRYNRFKTIRNENPNVGTIGSRYYKPVFYPQVEESEEDIYVITEFGDRLDLLANQFYSDVSLYWIIAIANPNVVSLGSLTPPVGTQLRIPINISTIIDSYNRLNEL